MSANIKAEPRERLGSRHARKLRTQGRIPASIQGGGGGSTEVSIEAAQFYAARRHHQHLFDIELPGGTTETALVRELQWEVLGQGLLHVEFRRVVRGQETEAEVELEFSGVPKGGVLNHLVTHITVRAEPQNLPDSIVVKVGHMEPGKPLFARDLIMPAGVKLAVPPEMPVAVVVIQKEEVVAPVPTAEGIAPAAGAAAPAGTTPATGATPAAGAAPAKGAPAAKGGAAAKGAAPAKEGKESKEGGKEKK